MSQSSGGDAGQFRRHQTFHHKRNQVSYDYTRPMSYLNAEAFKVPGPTNYFQEGHPLTTFTFQNVDLNPSVLQGKTSPSWTLGRQKRDNDPNKQAFGPGPAAYDSLLSLKRGIMRNKPGFCYYTESGTNNALVRKTMALHKELLSQKEAVASAQSNQAKPTAATENNDTLDGPQSAVAGRGDHQHLMTSPELDGGRQAAGMKGVLSNNFVGRSHHSLRVGSRNSQIARVSKTQQQQSQVFSAKEQRQTIPASVQSRTYNLLDQRKSLSPSRSVEAKNLIMSDHRRPPRDQNESMVMYCAHSPSPGQYDNFKKFFDRSKHRVVTIGQKFRKSNKNQGSLGPGPAAYDTRNRKFATGGGTGTTRGQQWSFGTQGRNINQDVIKRAKGLPACTDYSPTKKKQQIKISFGKKIIDALAQKRQNAMPGPANYSPNAHDIHQKIKTRLARQRPVPPPQLRPKLF